MGVMRQVQKKGEGKEGGEKITRSTPGGAAARTRDLPLASMPQRFRQASLSVPVARLGKLRNTTCGVVGLGLVNIVSVLN